MNYGAIKKRDIANGSGVRVSLFVSGCTHHCPGCFNKEAQSFAYGTPFTKETEDEVLEALSPSFIQGLTLLGGEPFEPSNQRVLLPFLRRVHAALPQKDIWAFSGYTYEELTGDSRANCESTAGLLNQIDVLVDGEFVEALHDISLQFRGSANQRVIDLRATREAGKVVLLNLK